jgi:hypothetical protein
MAEAAGSMAAEVDLAVVDSPEEAAARLAADHPEDRIAPRLHIDLRLPGRVIREVLPTHGPAEIRIVRLREIQGRPTLVVDARPVKRLRRLMGNGIRSDRRAPHLHRRRIRV